MSLFKISRGGYTDLPNDLTDGWAYFTPDNKGFYIDVVGNIQSTPYSSRIKINDRVDIQGYTVRSTSWQNKVTNLLIPAEYCDGTYIAELDINPSGTIAEQFTMTSAVAKANIKYNFDISNARIVLTCQGEQPTVNISFLVKFIPAELAYATLMNE